MNWSTYLVGLNMHVVPIDDPVHHDLTERCPCKVKWQAVLSEDGIVWRFLHQPIGYKGGT